jgi:hypothetical protein
MMVPICDVVVKMIYDSVSNKEMLSVENVLVFDFDFRKRKRWRMATEGNP